jgi:CNT family concentrative nucleoside transporter
MTFALSALLQAVTDTAVAAQSVPVPSGGISRFTGLLGIAAIVGVGFLLSSKRTAIKWRVVGIGLALQFAFAFVVLKTELGREFFAWLGSAITHVLEYSKVGAGFVFGQLADSQASTGMVFAAAVLPAIIFVSALFAILYYLGVMQWVVRAFATVMTKLMGASGAESLDVAASIFMGQTEAPLTIRPFLAKLTRSELMTVMTAGMAHISGSLMLAYIMFGVEARHLLAAVIMTAPGTIMIAKMMEPETEVAETSGNAKLDMPRTDSNVLEAAARGTSEGLHLMLNVVAMLIAFVALVALINGGFGWIHNMTFTVGESQWSFAWFPESLQVVLGWVGRPVAWLLGVSWQDSSAVGGLLGTRAVLNEFIAYSDLGPMKATLDPRSFTIASFALAGFANFSSIGIQIGGIGALVPERRKDLAALGFRAMLAGTMANFISAAIAGILL